MYFVLTQNPTNGSRVPLTDENGIMLIFENVETAIENAKRTLFGSYGYYDIYDLDEYV